MNEFRKRFVCYNMGLIAAILLIVFTLLGVFMYRRDVDELNKTMGLLVSPWDAPSADFRKNSKPPRPSSEHEQNAPEPPSITDRQPNSDGIIVLVYLQENEELIALNSELSLDDDALLQAARSIISQKKDNGCIGELGLIYHRETIENGFKIALADRSYITTRLLKNCLLLGAVFAFAMAVFYYISIKLASLASRPLENALSMERRFVADLSHDLKTPVTVVLANNSILRSSPDTNVSEQLQWIESTDLAAKNMLNLVDQMLTLSALDESESIQKTPIDLSLAAQKCVLQMESVAYEKQIELVSNIEESLYSPADRSKIERIFGGLIDNALKYEPCNGRIEVSLIKVRKKALFSVKNHNSFISEGDIEHIFERFYRADKSRNMGGHGLGLPIIKRSCELIGASIDVESSKSVGTVFTVCMDICSSDAAERK